MFIVCGVNAQDLEHYMTDTVTVSGTTNTTYLYPGSRDNFSQVSSYGQAYNLYSVIWVDKISGTIAASTNIYIDMCADMTCNVTFPIDTFTLADVGTTQKFNAKHPIDGAKFRYWIDTPSSTTSYRVRVGYYVKRVLSN